MMLQQHRVEGNKSSCGPTNNQKFAQFEYSSVVRKAGKDSEFGLEVVARVKDESFFCRRSGLEATFEWRGVSERGVLSDLKLSSGTSCVAHDITPDDISGITGMGCPFSSRAADMSSVCRIHDMTLYKEFIAIILPGHILERD